MIDWYVGTMGYGYQQWLDGVFYPAGLPKRQQLAYYAERFNAVEMDSTFYGTPSETAVTRWRHATPPGFRFCPKAPRAITHDLRLAGAEAVTDDFLDRMRLLGDRLGPILFQFPPDFTARAMGILESFLARLPADLSYAVEFRHTSWLDESTLEMLRRYRIARVSADYIHLPKQLHRTADFLYLRFLGRHGRYATKNREVEDRTAELQEWQRQIATTTDGLEAIHAFFNNDFAGFSPATANRFKAMAGLETAEIRPVRQQRLL